MSCSRRRPNCSLESVAKLLNRRPKLQPRNYETVNVETENEGVELHDMVIQLLDFAIFQSTRLTRRHAFEKFGYEHTQILSVGDVSTGEEVVVPFYFRHEIRWRQFQLYLGSDLGETESLGTLSVEDHVGRVRFGRRLGVKGWIVRHFCTAKTPVIQFF